MEGKLETRPEGMSAELEKIIFTGATFNGGSFDRTVNYYDARVQELRRLLRDDKITPDQAYEYFTKGILPSYMAATRPNPHSLWRTSGQLE